jgi:hypothetical protein
MNGLLSNYSLETQKHILEGQINRYLNHIRQLFSTNQCTVSAKHITFGVYLLPVSVLVHHQQGAQLCQFLEKPTPIMTVHNHNVRNYNRLLSIPALFIKIFHKMYLKIAENALV